MVRENQLYLVGHLYNGENYTIYYGERNSSVSCPSGVAEFNVLVTEDGTFDQPLNGTTNNECSLIWVVVADSSEQPVIEKHFIENYL